MTGVPDRYRIKDGITPLSAGTFNAILADVDQRLRRQEALERDYQAATRELISVGLVRINDVLVPAYQRVQALAELGFLVASAEAAPAVSFVEGTASLVVAAGDARDLFTPSPFVILTRSTVPTDWAVARRVSYDRTTGVLAFDIVSAAGSAGPHADVVAAAVAGSTLAQIDLLSQATTARTAAQAARAGAETARGGAETARDAAQLARAAVDARAAETELWSRGWAASTTNLTISAGTKVLALSAPLRLLPQNRALIVSPADPARWMRGTVTEAGDMSLTVDVDEVNGSGSASSWLVQITGTKGAKGDPGPAGPGTAADKWGAWLIVQALRNQAYL